VVPRVASAGVPFRRVAFIAARVVRTDGTVARRDAAAIDNPAATPIALACTPLVDGAGLALSGSRGVGGRWGLDATRTLPTTGGSGNGGLGANGSLAGGGVLAACGGLAYGVWSTGGFGTAAGLAGGGVMNSGGRPSASGGLDAPAAAAAASCLAAIDRTERAAVPADVIAGVLSRRSRSAAVGRFDGREVASAMCATPPSLAASVGSLSGRRTLSGSLSCGSS